MPTLKELEAEFIRYEKGIADKCHGRRQPDGTIQWGGFEVDTQPIVTSLQEAQGISFLCPLCFKKNNGPVGTHSVQVTFADRGVQDGQGSINNEGQPSRWNVVGGTGLDDLQLSPSIFLANEKGCLWHGFIGSNGVPPGCAE